MTIEFAGVKVQLKRLRHAIDARMATVIDHGQFVRGPEVEELERMLSSFVGVPYCVSCANGTDALQLALMALEVGRGDEVIVPAFSFFATVEAVFAVGADPVFVDIDPVTFCIDASQVRRAITERTRAVVAVSLFGQCADVDSLMRLTGARGIPLIEDGAQSFGAKHNGRRSGSLGDIGCTSFFPSKPLGCFGDGGAIFTRDPLLGERLLALSQHGQVARYRHEYLGMNSRLDTLQAAVLLEKMSVFEEEMAARAQIAEWYAMELRSMPLVLPTIAPGNESAWAQYTIRTPDRDSLADALRAAGIPTAVHYPVPMHRQPAIRSKRVIPVSDLAAREVLSLPMHPYLGRDDIAHIGSQMRSYWAGDE